MSVITKGRIFSNGEQLTAEKLNVLVDEASFNSSTAVDNSTTRVNGSGAITVKPQGITSTELASGAVQASNLATSALAAAYPVGSIYMNASNSNNPSTLLGFGTWAAFGAGRVLIGEGSDSDDQPTPETVSFTAGDEGGEYNHTLTTDEMPSHRHGGIYPAGSSGSFTQGFDVDNATSGNTLTQQKFTTYAGGDKTNGTEGTTQAHNNLQPYIVVYMWKRTA
jgi:hypothetical protein